MKSLIRGDRVESPGGRLLMVDDIFVPRHDREKGQRLPSRFRQSPRKIVVFQNGSIAPLQDIQANYKIVSQSAHAA